MIIITYDDPEFKAGDFFWYNNEKFTGLIREFRNDGTKMNETEVKDGLQYGYDRNWYPNDILESEYVEYNGKGVHLKEWDINGVLIYHKKYDHDLPDDQFVTVILDNRP